MCGGHAHTVAQVAGKGSLDYPQSGCREITIEGKGADRTMMLSRRARANRIPEPADSTFKYKISHLHPPVQCLCEIWSNVEICVESRSQLTLPASPVNSALWTKVCYFCCISNGCRVPNFRKALKMVILSLALSVFFRNRPIIIFEMRIEK
jgi:hypothetical protein